ncbi:MAG: alpha/beta fold hydrolase [Pseudomonadota bacterium]
MPVDSSNSLPPGFMDALLTYAIDPTQWEVLATEITDRQWLIDSLDPGSFLTLLSQAESFAWHLHQQPPVNIPGYIYFLLDDSGHVIYSNQEANLLPESFELNEGVFKFASNETQSQFKAGLDAIGSAAANQYLVELKAPNHSSFGYLVSAQTLPTHFTALAETPEKPEAAKFGFVVSVREPSQQVANLLKASFHLTGAEVSVCLKLCAGLSLKELAEGSGISANTARNHLQAVFEKTGLNRQSDLILMVTQLSVVMAVVSLTTDHHQNKTPHNQPNHRFCIVEGQRRVAYRVYGSGQRTVIYFHESSGTSRLPDRAMTQAAQHDLTIIAIERPGSGFSDPVPSYDFNTTSQDCLRVLQDLNIHTTVTLLGFMSGAAHALTTALTLGDQIKNIMLVSGRAPVAYPSGETNNLALLRYGLMNRPWLLRTFFNILRTRATPESIRATLLKVYGAVPHDRDLLLNNEALMQHMVDYILENLTVSGAGISGELQCFSSPAEIDLSKITAPIVAWHGAADAICPLPSLRSALDELNVHYRVFPEHGSLILLEYWDDVVDKIAELV